MLRLLFPGYYVEDVFSINYDALYKKGYRGLILDIDNTLVPHGEDSTAQVDEFFHKLHVTGFKTLLLSNNNKERIERFIKNIDTLYIQESGKPHPAAFIKAVKMMNLEKSQVMVIGDQVFTDILGANRAGLDSILVKYIGYYKKEKKGIRRNVEKIILNLYSVLRKHEKEEKTVL